MKIRSLGLTTDLALLQLMGSEVEDCGDHLVVRTPTNPSFWWGNFLLLPGPSQEVDRWLSRFEEAIPDADHRALAFDGTGDDVQRIGAFADAGLTCETSTVMTAHAVHEPANANRDAVYRALRSDEDWGQQVELNVACKDNGTTEEHHRVYAQQRADSVRALAEAGHGDWFGAFVDGVLLSAMGLFAAGPGLARFQRVETHPDARGKGLAGSLVHHVGRHGLSYAHTLVMVADPTYSAIRLYRSVGFVDQEHYLEASRTP